MVRHQRKSQDSHAIAHFPLPRPDSVSCIYFALRIIGEPCEHSYFVALLNQVSRKGEYPYVVFRPTPLRQNQEPHNELPTQSCVRGTKPGPLSVRKTFL